MTFPQHVGAFCLASLFLTTSSQLVAKPPQVEKAEPDNGAVDVDPGLREIRITFDQPMSKGGYSVMGGGPTFPISGKPKWMGTRTIVFPITLEPKQSYQLQINSNRKDAQKFKNRAGEPAVPYPIKFRTGSSSADAPAEPVDDSPLTPQQNRKAVNLLRTALSKHYSYRDRIDIDWDQLVTKHRDALLETKSVQGFAEMVATLLAKAEDKHIWLDAAGERIPTFVRPVTPNANFKQLSELVPGWTIRGSGVVSGRWPNDIGYLFIETWDQGKAKGLASIFDVLWELHDAPALVIDVRGNGGGSETIARAVAGCFVDQPVVYAKHVVCDPEAENGFSQPQERTLVPNKRRPRYRGQIAVLTGPVVMSSNEAFLLMMKQVPNTVLVGAPSQGSSGNPQPHDLENGVTIYLPSWRSMNPDGETFEGKGIPPDIEVSSKPEDFAAADPVLEAALEHLQNAIGR